MSTEKTILGIVPGLQSIALVGENVKFATGKKKNSTKDMFGLGVKNIVGVGLIGGTASMINSLS